MARAKRTKKPMATPVEQETAVEQAEHWLEAFARNFATATGRPYAFVIAVAVVAAWGVSGPFFGFSESWQTVMGTATTIITFLMVFLIQRAQNLDTMAIQAKLAELIIAMEGAQNKVAMAEKFSERELVALHEEHTEKAEEERAQLEHDVAVLTRARKKAASKDA